MSNLIDQMIKENHAGMGACEQKYVIESKPQRNLWRAIQPSSAVRILASQNLDESIHSRKLTAGTQSHEGWVQMVFLFKEVIFRLQPLVFREGKPGALIFDNKPQEIHRPLLASTRNITELLGPRKPMPISFLGRPGVCDTVAAWISCIPCGTLLSNVTPLSIETMQKKYVHLCI